MHGRCNRGREGQGRSCAGPPKAPSLCWGGGSNRAAAAANAAAVADVLCAGFFTGRKKESMFKVRLRLQAVLNALCIWLLGGGTDQHSSLLTI